MTSFKHIGLTILLNCLLLPQAQSEVNWIWQFGSESGTLTTTGSFADTQISFIFQITGFEVAQSVFPGFIGGEFTENQPTQGFIWDGNQPTQFFRSSGNFTNGANFFFEDSQIFYGLQPPSGNTRLRHAVTFEVFAEGPLLLFPDDTILSDGFE